MSPLLTALATLILALLTGGLLFSAVRRRQTEHEYLLFWRVSPRTHAITRNMFFRGPISDLCRILLFATMTLLFASQLFGLL